jgi:hypothetical protein
MLLKQIQRNSKLASPDILQIEVCKVKVVLIFKCPILKFKKVIKRKVEESVESFLEY